MMTVAIGLLTVIALVVAFGVIGLLIAIMLDWLQCRGEAARQQADSSERLRKDMQNLLEKRQALITARTSGSKPNNPREDRHKSYKEGLGGPSAGKPEPNGIIMMYQHDADDSTRSSPSSSNNCD